MLMAVQEPYALMVQQDDILINPRELDEPMGTMVCFHRRYALGDHHDFADKDAFLQKLYLDTVGNTPEGEASYENLVDSFSNERAADNALLDVISEKYIVQPLYLLDHSGLAMQTTSFHDPWDSGQVGWIYVSKEAVQKAFEISELTEDDLHKARTMLDSEVAIYDSYLRGECYGYELYKNGELEDSCWGFLGPVEEAVQAMTNHLPDECRDMVEHLEEQDHPATILPSVDFAALREVAPNVVGWLMQEDTNINYPITQAENNDYYLTHLYDGTYNKAGCLFSDYENRADFSDRSTIVYGHNMRDGSMFASLNQYRKQSYYEAHPTMTLLTPEGGYVVELFAAFSASPKESGKNDSPWRLDFENDADFAVWLSAMSSRSQIQTETAVTARDKVLTLSTCNGSGDRFIVMGKLTAVN